MKNIKFGFLGILFGIVLVKSEVISWFRIQEMFRLQGFHMYGIIGSAIIVGIISIQLIKRFELKTINKETIVIREKKFHWGNVYGGLIFGLGWAITGACPGPLFAEIGSGFLVITITLLSAIAGTWFYGLLRKKTSSLITSTMKIEQFEDKGLAHYSYAILSECASEIVLVDPSRDTAPYLAFAELHHAKIIGVIETHPHADFVSGHLELHQHTGATIYCSKLVGAAYPHQTFDDGNIIVFGKIKLRALNTPGHSPDSICIVLEHEGMDKAVFTGDTLFIGDCGRPDLRENAGSLTAKREQLANLMYHSLRNQLMVLDNEVLVYPAHGAGTLCGKALSAANSSTIGAEKLSNWCLQDLNEAKFTRLLLQEQPFVPKYFPYNVELNKNGAPGLAVSIKCVPFGKGEKLDKSIVIVDTRPAAAFKKGHFPGSVNLQKGGKFETWLGSIIAPGEAFYLLAESNSDLEELVLRCATIGYEAFIARAFALPEGKETMELLDIAKFKFDPQCFTIVDTRNEGEIQANPVFKNAITMPLPQLRERVLEIPFNKPIVVHCAGGYRSAAGSSIIQNAFGAKTKVFDLGDAIKDFL